MSFLVILAALRARAAFLNAEADGVVRFLGMSEFGCVRVGDGLVVGMNNAKGVVLYEIRSDLSVQKVFELSGNNEYFGIKIFSNATCVFILISAKITYAAEIPSLENPLNANKSASQTILLLIQQQTYAVTKTLLLNQCSNYNLIAFDSIYYSGSLLVLLKDGNTNKLILQSIGVSCYPMNISMIYAKILILNSFVYIIGGGQDMSVYKFDMSLVLIWSVMVSRSPLIDFTIQTDRILLQTSNVLYQITESGAISLAVYFPLISFSAIEIYNNVIYTLGQLNTTNIGVLSSLSSDFSVKSQRQYQNITKFQAIQPGLGTSFYMVISSNQSFYNDVALSSINSTVIFKATQPFETNLCNAACNTCYGSSSNDCYSCKFYETSFNSSNSCGTCHPACSSCFGAAVSQCFKCSIGYILFSSTCYKTLNCPIGTYQSYLQQSCNPCNQVCNGCTGPSANDCIKCGVGYLLDTHTCVGSCPMGKYSDGLACQSCNSRCATCKGPTASDCLSCPPGTYLFNNSCNLSCPNTTFSSGLTCVNCSSGCLACSNHLCYECKQGYYLVSNGCEKCDVGCSLCNSSSACLSCAGGFKKSLEKCVAVCSDGYYPSAAQCLVCDKSCKTCNGPQRSQCQTCFPGLNLIESTCVSSCPSSYFSSNGNCTKCATGCLNCLSSAQCLQCDSSLSLVQGSCLNCGLNNCTCSSSCSTCLKGMCLLCIQSYYLKQGVCIKNCSSTDIIINNTCYCKENCEVCEDNDCAKCLSGFYLLNGSCVECRSGCDVCEFDGCQICLDGFLILEGECVRNCPQGFSIIDQVCVKCGDRCKVCNMTQCIECEYEVEVHGYYENLSGICSKNLTCIAGFDFNDLGTNCTRTVGSQAWEFLSAFPTIKSFLRL